MARYIFSLKEPLTTNNKEKRKLLGLEKDITSENM
jgi:hypothetical protein